MGRRPVNSAGPEACPGRGRSLASGRVRTQVPPPASASWRRHFAGSADGFPGRREQCGLSQACDTCSLPGGAGWVRSGFWLLLSSEAGLLPRDWRWGCHCNTWRCIHFGFGHSFHSRLPLTLLSLRGDWGGRRTPALVLDLPLNSYETLA